MFNPFNKANKPGGLFAPRKGSALTKWSEDDFKAAFRLFDRDRDGTITRTEVLNVLRTLGQDPTKDEMDQLIGDIDADGDGTIDMKEFRTMMQRLMESNEADDKELLEEAFKEFDVFDDGFIGVEDLLYVFRKLGDDEITRMEVEQMIVDATGSSERKAVTFEEFKAVTRS